MELICDLRAVAVRWQLILPVMRGRLIDPAFRERLMLAVTAVNTCRYCSYIHTRQALVEGVTPEELASLAQGELAGPQHELPALLYAQHWAESQGKPDPAAYARIVAQYGQELTAGIELTLRLIRLGNLTGNTFDWLLSHLTFGRWGAFE